jgi:hypothetical protein
VRAAFPLAIQIEPAEPMHSDPGEENQGGSRESGKESDEAGDHCKRDQGNPHAVQRPEHMPTVRRRLRLGDPAMAE